MYISHKWGQSPPKWRYNPEHQNTIINTLILVKSSDSSDFRLAPCVIFSTETWLKTLYCCFFFVHVILVFCGALTASFWGQLVGLNHNFITQYVILYPDYEKLYAWQNPHLWKCVCVCVCVWMHMWERKRESTWEYSHMWSNRRSQDTKYWISSLIKGISVVSVFL